MNNAELFAAFEEFLQVDANCQLLAAFSRTSLVADLREFAAAIDPVPLEDATEQEVRVFLSDRRPKGIPANSTILAKTQKAMADLRHSEYKAAMLGFREFRRSILKSRKKGGRRDSQ